MGHKRMPGLRFHRGKWHIQKSVRGFGTLRECTETASLEEAEQYLIRRLEQIRQQLVFGVRPARFFADAAAKYIKEDQTVRNADAASWLQQAMPFIGSIELSKVHDETLKPFVVWCRERGNKSKTIHNKLAVIRRVLNLAARRWRDPVTGLTWLDTLPLITMPSVNDAREPYPLDWREQGLLFPLLPKHLQPMALFMVHTGVRDVECCKLQWEQEHRIDGVDASIFVLTDTKNGDDRVVVCNAVAQRVIEAQRGKSDLWVFPYRGRNVVTMNNNGWQDGRRKAVAAYEEHLGRSAPEGFRTLHVHDLRHTFGRRLRAAGVSHETRQDLLGHRNGNMTTHYSAAELLELLKAVKLVESGASAPLLRNVHRSCTLEMTTGCKVAASR